MKLIQRLTFRTFQHSPRHSHTHTHDSVNGQDRRGTSSSCGHHQSILLRDVRKPSDKMNAATTARMAPSPPHARLERRILEPELSRTRPGLGTLRSGSRQTDTQPRAQPALKGKPHTQAASEALFLHHTETIKRKRLLENQIDKMHIFLHFSPSYVHIHIHAHCIAMQGQI